ncbi:MAG: riboflavin synthase [Phycisphaerae bacterium]|nr:riboflavin synthase [Phycisphaerae bacterium]
MFTGLVQAVGSVAAVEPSAAGRRLEIDTGSWEILPNSGESICVNGVCLTVAEVLTPRRWAFDVVNETLARTTLGAATAGSRLNLERSATPTSLLGGHLVQGHVDGVGEIVRVERGDGWRVRVSTPRSTPAGPLIQYMIPKGSVTLDGVSLTLADVGPVEGWIEIALIPLTLRQTTLAGWVEGQRVNIECDAMAKTVIHWMRHFSGASRG